MHFFEAVRCFVVIVLRVNNCPGVFLEEDWVAVFDLPVGVSIPSCGLFTVLEHRWVVNVTLDLMLLWVELDFKLFEFPCLHQFIDDFNNAFHALVGVGDLKILEVFHLASIRCEIIRE